MQATDPGKELGRIRAILDPHEITLDNDQPHISGERFLLSPQKLVLLGHKNGDRVVVKASNTPEGKQEIRQEKLLRDTIKTLAFAGDVLLVPKEIYFGEEDGYTIFITAYIQQEKPFMSLPLQEQFFSALRAFEAQESFHATTWEHSRKIEGIFEVLSSKKYIHALEDYTEIIKKQYPDPALAPLLSQAQKFLRDHAVDIDRYCGYLTHTDFVPHNFRSKERQLYVLDHTAIHFGSKYEGWARFLNFMLIHNPDLEQMLTQHLRTERGEGEYLALRLMRVYKIVLLLKYYAQALPQTTDDLETLTKKRLEFWTEVLEAVLNNTPLHKETRNRYVEARNRLRTPEETARQKEIAHI